MRLEMQVLANSHHKSEHMVIADSHHKSEHMVVVGDSRMFIAETLGKGGQGGGEAQESFREGAPLCT